MPRSPSADELAPTVERTHDALDADAENYEPILPAQRAADIASARATATAPDMTTVEAIATMTDAELDAFLAGLDLDGIDLSADDDGTVIDLAKTGGRRRLWNDLGTDVGRVGFLERLFDHWRYGG